MGLEMAGSRVLATFFGSSIYVWGAIISIFLAALSVGYFVGGMVADRRPDFNVLIYLLLFDGIWLLLIPLYANGVCRAILSLGPGQRLGPLLSTLILFGGPSVLLGMVSPFAVRLAARSVQQMGNISGSLYALSTLGSIAGTLITAFWLVPAIGVRAILQILGISLLILPLLVVIPLRRKIWFVSIAFLMSSASIVGLRFSLTPTTDRKIVYEADSAYHHILVIDDAQRKTRFLQFNNYVEGGIDLDPPYETRLSYSNAFQLARIFKQKIDNILIIGGGGGIVARKFVTDDPNVVVDQVELDPRVVEVSHKFFHLETGPRLRVHVEDGRNYVRRTSERYDVVMLDAFTIGGQIPFHLTTMEFFREIQQVLKTDGVLVANLNGSMQGPRSAILRSEYKTLASVFDNVYFFPHLTDIERERALVPAPDRKRNLILLATTGQRLTNEMVQTLAMELKNGGRVSSPTFIEDASVMSEVGPLASYPVFTDDYAPVDVLAF